MTNERTMQLKRNLTASNQRKYSKHKFYPTLLLTFAYFSLSLYALGIQ